MVSYLINIIKAIVKSCHQYYYLSECSTSPEPWRVDWKFRMERKDNSICVAPGKTCNQLKIYSLVLACDINSKIGIKINKDQRLSCSGERIKFDYTNTEWSYHNVEEVTKEQFENCKVTRS